MQTDEELARELVAAVKAAGFFGDRQLRALGVIVDAKHTKRIQAACRNLEHRLNGLMEEENDT